MTRNKTAATWLALLGGVLGLHRFYLHGVRDWCGWLMPLPSLLGLYGLLRVRQFGLDDRWSWFLIPWLGLAASACALTAIVYGLTPTLKWNARFNPREDSTAQPGATNWLTVAAVVVALLLGTTVLMSTLAFSFQRIFEYQTIAAPINAS